MPFTRVVIQEQYETATGGPAVGSVEFTPVDQMHNGSLVISAPQTDTLDTSGNLSIDLAATTDPATTPVGVTYRVIERIVGQPVRTYYVHVPHDQGSPLQLADLPTYPTGGSAGFALRNAIDYDDAVAPTDGQAMVWDTTVGKFHPETVAGVGAGVSSVNGLTGAVTVSPASIAAQPVDSDLTAIAALSPADGSLLERVGGAWSTRTPTQVKGDLGLDLVSNTSDATKPVSTPQQTALNLKANLASPTFTGTVSGPRFVPGLVTVAYAASVTLDASAGATFRCVATGNLVVSAINGGVQGQEVKLEVQASGGARTVTVNGIASTVASGEWGTWRLTWNTATSLWVLNDLPAPTGGGSVTSVNGQTGAVTVTAAGLGAQPADQDLTDIAALAPTNGDLLERVGGVWAARPAAQVKADLGLDQVNNTSDAAKPISTATSTALNLKATVADPTFTGTVAAPRFVGAVVDVAYAASVTLDAQTGTTFRVIAVGPVTLADITGGVAGQEIRVDVFASGATRTVTVGGASTDVVTGQWWIARFTFDGPTNTWRLTESGGGGSTGGGGGGSVTSVNGQLGAVTITPTGIGAQPIDQDLTALAALAAADDDVVQRKAGVWANRTPAQLKTDLALDQVNNTSDAAKPISTATQTALTALSTSKAAQTDLDALSTSTTAAVAAKAPQASPTFTGTASAPRFVTPPVTIAYAATVTPDAAASCVFRCVATGDLTLASPTGGVDGQEILVAVQASGGDRTILFAGGTLNPVTIATGEWWIGTARYYAATDDWFLDTGGGGGVTDHGALTGLADDDHPQYAKKAGDTFTGDVTFRDTGNTQAWRLRTSGAEVDLDAGAAVATFSTWSTAAMNSGQVTHLALNPNTGNVEFRTPAQQTGQQGLSALRFMGRRATTGAPTTGSFLQGDVVIDIAGAWWLCTTTGTPGTWASADAGGTTASGILAWDGSTYSPAALRTDTTAPRIFLNGPDPATVAGVTMNADPKQDAWYSAEMGADAQLLTNGEESMSREFLRDATVAFPAATMLLTYFTATRSEAITQVRILTGGTAMAGASALRVGVYSIASNGDGTRAGQTASVHGTVTASGTEYTAALAATWNKVAGNRYAMAFGNMGATAGTLAGQVALASAASAWSRGARLAGRVALTTMTSGLPSSFSAVDVLNANERFYGEVLP